MTTKHLTLQQLWRDANFTPTEDQQEKAILHVQGPLYLPAGPGSGKTRVLLWRTLNLIVFHGIKPEEIYLSTFTEKAAFQLKEGLRALLASVTARTGQPYDIAKMYVGTVHSLCQRIILDRRFYPDRQRGKAPVLLDELGQYFYLYKRSMWSDLTSAVDLGDDPNATINELFSDNSTSRHTAVTHTIGLFNRLSEECLDPDEALDHTSNPVLRAMLEMYRAYTASLQSGVIPSTDFSLLQQAALRVLQNDGADRVFKHVIIDEYQDTNTVQERIFFRLAGHHKNLCVVGDDDQALYRFRGATVENFVQFPERCKAALGVKPTPIPLGINFRSSKHIVDFYTDFISRCDWSRPAPKRGHYRVTTKAITAKDTGKRVAVVASQPAAPEAACQEIAAFVKRLLDEGKVQDPNQIAFLFPSLKYRGQVNSQVARMKQALEDLGLSVYAPRAGRFLEIPEATDLLGVYLHIFGKPARNPDIPGHDYHAFHDWLTAAHDQARSILKADKQLAQYVQDRQAEIAVAAEDYTRLAQVVQKKKWELSAPYDLAAMKRPLYDAPGLSPKAKKFLSSVYFEKIIQRRIQAGQPFSLKYILTSATSVDWSVLDLLYRLCGFQHFKHMLDLAESGENEGPICNLGLLSQYLARFMDEYSSIITADLLVDNAEGFQRLFFTSYLYTLFRRSESEYEDAQDPFPKGCIPFLTIHQAKGLEFPVVVLGNARKDDRGPQPVETLVQDLLDRDGGEPLDRMNEFDIMRMFYVALSRAQNLLVIAHFAGRGNRVNQPFKAMLDNRFPRIADYKLDTLPVAKPHDDDLPKNYSYTGDYLLYQKCPRQYMLFREYGFVPSRSQTMLFGNLVHRTLDDLHQYLIATGS